MRAKELLGEERGEIKEGRDEHLKRRIARGEAISYYTSLGQFLSTKNRDIKQVSESYLPSA
jgi:hypothetical protein